MANLIAESTLGFKAGLLVHSCMARFTVTHCRKVELESSEFEVRILSGEIRKGDYFSCRGAYHHTEFRVQLVQGANSDVKLVCTGNVAFDNEFAGVTLDTEPVRLPPPDSFILAAIPSPTSDEEHALESLIGDLQTRSMGQRAACLCLLRGDDTHAKIARSLGITIEQVRTTLNRVCGVVYDSGQDKLFFR